MEKEIEALIILFVMLGVFSVVAAIGAMIEKHSRRITNWIANLFADPEENLSYRYSIDDEEK